MAEFVRCGRCGKEQEPLARAPLPGELGEEIKAKVCPTCWSEWQAAEVMVINELRLNFMDPNAQDTLNRHMREFLFLDGGPGAGTAAEPPGPESLGFDGTGTGAPARPKDDPGGGSAGS